MGTMIGQTLGQYEVVALLGRGGMASVYKAYQPGIERHVALKILPRHFADDPQFVGRFRQEAKVLANLQHLHILPVHDFGEAEGYTYIVMPLVTGGTLAALLQGQPLPLDQVRRIMSQLGAALDYAHARGVVHRDIKPGNVLLDESGNCLLTDFGIAKLLEASQQFTIPGGIVGTPAYMSPEQGLGKPLDSRSDIYALGAVLYEMVTGRVPFKAESPMGVVVKHINDELPPPSTLNLELPDAVERVILKALDKQAAGRFTTAGEMANALSAIPERSVQPGASDTIPMDIRGDFKESTVPLDVDEGTHEARGRAATRWTVALGAAAVVVAAITGAVWPEPPPTAVPGSAAGGQALTQAAAPPATARVDGDPARELAESADRREPQDAADPSRSAATDARSEPQEDETDPAASDRRELIASVQAGLSRLGYEAGSADGVAGVNTAAAVRSFQQRYNAFRSAGDKIPEDGRVSTSLLQRINGSEPLPAATARAEGFLLISVDAPSTVTIDGDPVGAFRPGDRRLVGVEVGRRLVMATAEDGEIHAQVLVEATSRSRKVVQLELAARIAEWREREVAQQALRDEETRKRDQEAAALIREEERRRKGGEAAAPGASRPPGRFVPAPFPRPVSLTRPRTPSVIQRFEETLHHHRSGGCRGVLSLRRGVIVYSGDEHSLVFWEADLEKAEIAWPESGSTFDRWGFSLRLNDGRTFNFEVSHMLDVYEAKQWLREAVDQ